MNVKKFQKTVENFTCENCGAEVIGNGYTNHCPKCLFSKHVDIYPGDRFESCLGLMKPIAVEQKRDDFILVFQCQKCNFIRKNKVQPTDDFEKVLEVAKKRKLE
jgi:rubrerythrin